MKISENPNKNIRLADSPISRSSFDQQPPIKKLTTLEEISEKLELLTKQNQLISLSISILYSSMYYRINMDSKFPMSEDLKSSVVSALNELSNNTMNVGKIGEVLINLKNQMNIINHELDMIQSEFADQISPDMSSNGSKIFIRSKTFIDQLGIIKTIEDLIQSYSQLSHLAFPNYYFETVKELLHYSSTPYSQVKLSKTFLNIPINYIKILIEKLLREAPSARLLQNLHRLFPPLEENNITESELKQIQILIFNYYKNLENYLVDNEFNVDSFQKVDSIKRNFNFGSGDVETRIPMVFFNVIKIVHEKNLGELPEFEKIIHYETIRLISNLNDSILNTPRFKKLLKSLK